MTDRPPTNSTDSPAAAPTRRRRWPRRALVIVALILVFAIGGGQVVLWTDLPRRIVVAQLQRQLGLNIAAESLSTGWFGHTRLRGVTATLPLADESFVRIPRLEVSHTSLVAMIFNRPLRLETISMNEPVVIVRQNASGRWNVQEAVELIARAGGKGAVQESTRRAQPAAIPRINIDSATIRIINNAGRAATIAPIVVRGDPGGELAYQYDVRAGEDRLTLSGRFVPGGLWLHEAALEIRNVDEWVAPLLPAFPEQAAAQLHWRGQRTDRDGGDEGGGIAGRLEIRSLAAADVAASGVLRVSAGGGSVTLTPQDILIDPRSVAAPDVRVNSGSIVFRDGTLHARQLRLVAADGVAQLNGAWNLAANTGRGELAWNALRYPAGVEQSGQVEATLETPWPGEPRMAARIVSNGSIAAAGRWESELTLSAQGQSLADLAWAIDFSRARYEGERELVLDGLALRGRREGQLVSLTGAALPGRGHIDGRGTLHLGRREWWLWLEGRDLSVPRGTSAAAAAPISFSLNTWGALARDVPGDDDTDAALRIHLDEAYLRTGDIEAWAQGAYNTSWDLPLSLDLWLTHLPPTGKEVSEVIQGDLRATAQLTGTANPLALDVEGIAYGHGLFFRQRSLGDVAARVTGHITPRHVDLRTTRLKLFGASWDVDARYPTSHPREALRLTVKVEDLPLREIGDIFGGQDVHGHADGDFELLVFEPDLDRLRLGGTFAATGVAVDAFRADSVTGSLALNGGQIIVDPIEVRSADGRATAAAESSLRDLGRWRIRLTAEELPVEVPRTAAVTARVSGEADLRADFIESSILGTARVEASLLRAGEELGEASARVTADARSVRAEQFRADLLGGTVAGAGTILLGSPFQSEGYLTWERIDASRIARWVPRAEGLRGVFAGSITVAPAGDPRALEPSQIQVQLAAEGGGFRALSFEGASFAAYAGPGADAQRFRVIIPKGTIRAAGGQTTVFAALNRRRHDTLSAQLTADFSGLNLDEIVHAAAPEHAEPMPGLLSGRLSLLGDPNRPRDLTGDITLSLNESDLANFDPIGFLYQAMRIGQGGAGEARGRGSVQARLEGQVVYVDNAYLFNRGVEIRGIGTVREIFNLPDSPLDGTLVGTARPLKDLELPFLADVDEIFSVLQANATTVVVSGHLRHPQVRQSTLAEAGETIRELLLGDVKRESGR